MDRTFRERFWDRVCDYEGVLRILFAVNVLFLVLLLIASIGIESGSASYVILVVDLVILVPVLLLSLYLVWRCENFVREDHF